MGGGGRLCSLHISSANSKIGGDDKKEGNDNTETGFERDVHKEETERFVGNM